MHSLGRYCLAEGDPESGLHYDYFRHFGPETGRCVTSDPLGLSPAPNPSAYVRNPLKDTDVPGLAPERYRALDKPGGDHHFFSELIEVLCNGRESTIPPRKCRP
nr:RHS repeat-associated core domain-containing protein [Streptomyces sp. MH60]